jgi:ABC-type antimicrobial peptide transport system permease subunit
MNPGRLLLLALVSLRRNKVRAGLTMLGIAIGVLAVIATLAVGRGASAMITTQLNAVGKNILLVLPEAAMLRGLSFGAGSATSLTPQDAAAIRAEVRSVRLAAPMIRTRDPLVNGNRNWTPMVILGTSAAFLEIREWPLEEGSPFTEDHVASGARVCLLGRTVAVQLFQDEPVIGEMIRIRNMPFKVVGILGQKGVNLMGIDQDDMVILPWTTVKSSLLGSAFNNLHQILLSTESPGDLEDAAGEVTSLLRQRHRLTADQENDFTVLTMTEMAVVLNQTAKTMTTLLGILASIALIVGGIGIMNVMFVSVVQRTHEIGLRMAVGARRRDILIQFLMEAGVLSIVAGSAGAIAGVGVAEIITRTTHWPVTISIGSISVAYAFSAAVGLAFGFFPALRASRLDPVEALRYE